MKSVGIAGMGKVGKAMGALFKGHVPYYDPPLNLNERGALEQDFLFICVPTPEDKDGFCDTSIVEEILEKSKAGINIIRSTVTVGFTDRMLKKYDKKIVFMPEYGPSDFPNHPFNDLSKVSWAVIGGDKDTTREVAEFWEQTLYNVKVFKTDARTAEFLKLVENAYFYTKVGFFQEIYDLAWTLDINYDEMRLMLTEDPRIEADHSFISEDNRVIGGACLPKDMANLIRLFDFMDLDADFFKMLVERNEKRS